MAKLSGKTVAVLATDGVEQIELTEPVKALKGEGATVEIVSLKAGAIQGFEHLTPGEQINVDVALDQADARRYDALVLPGGVANPDLLRADKAAVNFVKAFFADDRPVAAICHAPWLLVEAGVVEGRSLTGYNSIRTDLSNAGGKVEDRAVVIDGNLITSRNPDDIPAFNAAIIKALGGQA